MVFGFAPLQPANQMENKTCNNETWTILLKFLNARRSFIAIVNPLFHNFA